MKSNRFTVEFDGEAIPGWQTVELPSISIEQGNYREKEEGSNYETKEWGEELSQELELEMSRAVLKGDSTLWDWRRAVNEESDEARKRVSIKLLDDEGVVEYEERFLAAWPKEYEPPDLDASADDEETADETIRLKFDNVIERKRVQLDDDD